MFKANQHFCSLVLCLLLSGCGGSAAVPPAVSGKDLIREYNSGNGTNSSITAAHGGETRFAYGAISGTGGTNCNGVGFLHTYQDGVSIATINLNVLAAPAGEHYIVWTSDGAGSQYSLIFRGELKSIVGDARHSMQFESDGDPNTLSHVFVTVEKSVTPVTASSPIAEGTLKELKPPNT